MEKLINKIAKLASKYKYSEIKQRDFEKYIGKEEKGVKTLKLFADKKDLYNNTWVQIYECDGETVVAFYYQSGPSGAWDPLDYWATDEAWHDMINCDL